MRAPKAPNEGRRRRQISRRQSAGYAKEKEHEDHHALGAALAIAANAAAQSYPAGRSPRRRLRARGGTDTVARVMQRSSASISARPSSSRTAPAPAASSPRTWSAKAAPERLHDPPRHYRALAVAPHLNSKLPYHPLRDFAPISMATVSGNVLVVHPSLPARPIAEYVKEANSRPGGSLRHFWRRQRRQPRGRAVPADRESNLSTCRTRAAARR